jgi:L-methionine (R)-S-oxide reductase
MRDVADRGCTHALRSLARTLSRCSFLMAETTLDLRGVPKGRAYADLQIHIEHTLHGIRDEVTAMSTIAALVHHGFGHLWTGFYRVVELNSLLRVGPYQGTLGCLEITWGRGVCGTAAAERRTVLVPDVSAFRGHIACDARARSEIVVPVVGANDQLVAVLDVDSERLNAFDDEDRRGLEHIVRWFRHTSDKVVIA